MTTYINRDTDIYTQDFLIDSSSQSSLSLTSEDAHNILFSLDFDETMSSSNTSKNSTFTPVTIELYLDKMVQILFTSAKNLNQDINLESKFIHEDTYHLCKVVYDRDYEKITSSVEETTFNDMFQKICKKNYNIIFN
jgi:hypothetical protein